MMQTAIENIRSAYKVYIWYKIVFKNGNPDSRIQTENPASKNQYDIHQEPLK